jgi:hypothetical protein
MHSLLLACLLACLCCGSFKDKSRRVQERAARERRKKERGQMYYTDVGLAFTK